MGDLISIIIPCYNVEKYLKKCIDSVLNQTYKNIEIILIDDGSTDKTKIICDEYFRQNNNIIQVFHNDNHGVSYSRNFGIMKSNGKYIMFVDSDDFIDKDYVENMYNCLKNAEADLVYSNHVLDYGLKTTQIHVPKELLYNDDISFPKCINVFFSSYIFSSSCKMLIKKEILLTNNIKFDETMKYGEDMKFSFMTYCKSKCTRFLNNAGYHYFINFTSASHSNEFNKKIKNCNDNLKLYQYMYDELTLNKIDFDYILFNDAILKNLNGILNAMIRINSKYDYKSILSLYKDYLTHFNYTKSKLGIRLKIEILLIKKNFKLYKIMASFKGILIKIIKQ